MRVTAIILVSVFQYCCSQDDYNTRLSARLQEIETLEFFDNGVVVLDDTSRSGFPRWISTEDYYQDDIVSLNGETFRALVDSKGMKPNYSPDDWEFIHGTYHPYQFLRDTAKVDDLKKLLTHSHPYIRTYAFGALAHRNADGLFEVILDNLGDTTRFEQMTGDYGYYVCAADLMIQYEGSEFSNGEIETLQKLIMTTYPHLIESLDMLKKK